MRRDIGILGMMVAGLGMSALSAQHIAGLDDGPREKSWPKPSSAGGNFPDQMTRQQRRAAEREARKDPLRWSRDRKAMS